MADRPQNLRQKLAASGGGGVVNRPLIEYDDIIVEILSRLPARCLIRFRSVCKSWRALISGSHLVRKHLSRAVTGVSPNSYRLLVSVSPLQSIAYEALKDFNGYVPSRELHLPGMLECMKVVGSCNGLICLQVNETNLLLWNPCTSDTNMLPALNWLPRTAKFYGFGYDSTIEDYKVVVGFTCSNTTKIAFFTLKRGSWRTVEVLGILKFKGKGCLLNGALHWVEFHWASERIRSKVISRIISFDLAEEKFREMGPLCQNCAFVQIGTVTNCLFVSIYDYRYDTFRIWIMKEYGVRQSWSEILQIQRELYNFRPRLRDCSLRLMCILESGEVLTSCNSSYLVLYNPKEKTFKSVLHTPVTLLPEATMYIETLVSPVTGSGADI